MVPNHRAISGRLPGLLALVLCCAACGAHSPVPPAPPDADVVPSVEERCDVLRRHLEDNSAGLARFWCHPTKRGVWALGFSGLSEDESEEEPRVDAAWAVAFSGPSGEAAAHVASFEFTDYCRYELEDSGLFDIDGDGLDELVFNYLVSCHEGPYATFGHIMTARAAGPPVEYPEAERYHPYRTEDFDGDGRPDLWSHRHYTESVSNPADFEEYWRLHLPVHALPDGTYTMHDAPAVAATRRACPEDPLIGWVDDGEPQGDPHNFVACARVWGASKSAMRVLLAAECADVDEKLRAECGGDLECDTASEEYLFNLDVSPLCMHASELESINEVDPPVTLGPPR
jgi:hypothetical protein